MSVLDGMAFRAGIGSTSAIEIEGSTFEPVKFRAYEADTVNPSEPLPDPDLNRPSTGIVVDEDYKTRLDNYIQLWRKPYEESGLTIWPDLAWKWIKHPYYIVTSNFGPKISTPPPTEIYLTELGPFWKHKYQRGFESSSAGYLKPIGAFPSRYAYTAHIKFTWAGAPLASKWNESQWGTHGLSSDNYFANAGAGVYLMGISPSTPVDAQMDGSFFISFRYGYYDPGPADSQALHQVFYYPVTSVVDPVLAWESQELDPGNGNAGKYTFVMTCDNITTKVGMIQGHQGGDIEWFGEMIPFSYNRGGNTAGEVNIATAISKYQSPRNFGTIDVGGFLGSSYANWSGWINEIAVSIEPYDTLLGELGHLQPYYGYPHLEHVRFRANA